MARGFNILDIQRVEIKTCVVAAYNKRPRCAHGYEIILNRAKLRTLVHQRPARLCTTGYIPAIGSLAPSEYKRSGDHSGVTSRNAGLATQQPAAAPQLIPPVQPPATTRPVSRVLLGLIPQHTPLPTCPPAWHGLQ